MQDSIDISGREHALQQRMIEARAAHDWIAFRVALREFTDLVLGPRRPATSESRSPVQSKTESAG